MEEEKEMTQDPMPKPLLPQLSPNILYCPLKKAKVGAGDLNLGLPACAASDLTH